MLLLAALVTTIYSLRLLFLVFYNKYRDKDFENIREQSKIITLPLIILSVLSIISGYLIKVFIDLPIFMFGVSDIHYNGIITFIEHGILSPATLALVLGFYIAKKIYKDKISLNFIENNLFNKISLIIKSKYKFDEFFILVSDFMKSISFKMSKNFDLGLIDGWVVNGFPKKINSLAVLFKRKSSGYLYHYAFSIVFSLVIIFGIILARVI
jgi:NADH-quinone oxidoreductase subunit L